MSPLRVFNRSNPDQRGHIVAFVPDSTEGLVSILAVVVWDNGTIIATDPSYLQVSVPIGVGT